MNYLFEFDRQAEKCPFCNTKMIISEFDDFYHYCSNECITIYFDVHTVILDVVVFNEDKYELLLHENHGYGKEDIKSFEKEERKLLERIKELKENDAYLMKILQS